MGDFFNILKYCLGELQLSRGLANQRGHFDKICSTSSDLSDLFNLVLNIGND
jgi:hypothetical protein